MELQTIYTTNGTIDLAPEKFRPAVRLDVIVGNMRNEPSTLTRLHLTYSNLKETLTELEKMETKPKHPSAYMKMNNASIWVYPSKTHAVKTYELEVEIIKDEATTTQKTAINHTEYKELKQAIELLLKDMEEKTQPAHR